MTRPDYIFDSFLSVTLSGRDSCFSSKKFNITVISRLDMVGFIGWRGLGLDRKSNRKRAGLRNPVSTLSFLGLIMDSIPTTQYTSLARLGSCSRCHASTSNYYRCDNEKRRLINEAVVYVEMSPQSTALCLCASRQPSSDRRYRLDLLHHHLDRAAEDHPSHPVRLSRERGST